MGPQIFPTFFGEFEPHGVGADRCADGWKDVEEDRRNRLKIEDVLVFLVCFASTWGPSPVGWRPLLVGWSISYSFQTPCLEGRRKFIAQEAAGGPAVGGSGGMQQFGEAGDFRGHTGGRVTSFAKTWQVPGELFFSRLDLHNSSIQCLDLSVATMVGPIFSWVSLLAFPTSTRPTDGGVSHGFPP